MIRLAAVGTASTGKSAVLNALFGTDLIVDARAKSTSSATSVLVRFGTRTLELLDTPPLDDAAPPLSADIYLLVCDKDLVDAEYREVVRIERTGRPAAVAINKADLYSPAQRRQLLQQVRRRLNGIIPAARIVSCAADPVRSITREDISGHTCQWHERIPPDVEQLRNVVHELLLEAEASLRIRTRRLGVRGRDAASQASSRIANWIHERYGKE
jgi:hypothetical protein